jgi:hypothetical protein
MRCGLHRRPANGNEFGTRKNFDRGKWCKPISPMIHAVRHAVRKSVSTVGFVLAALIAGGALGVRARDDGQYRDVPGHIRDWFSGLTNPRTGRSCCDESDCARTEARTRGGSWEAKAPDGSWITVPPESIVVDQGNPTGEPVLCAYESETGWRVLCFVPGPAG